MLFGFLLVSKPLIYRSCLLIQPTGPEKNRILFLVGGCIPTPLKNMTSSIGMIGKFPRFLGKWYPNGNQTTNQYISYIIYIYIYISIYLSIYLSIYKSGRKKNAFFSFFVQFTWTKGGQFPWSGVVLAPITRGSIPRSFGEVSAKGDESSLRIGEWWLIIWLIYG